MTNGWGWVNGAGKGNGDPAVETWAEGIEGRLCARVVELETQLVDEKFMLLNAQERADNLSERVATLEDRLNQAIVENNKLRAELGESLHAMGEEWAKEYTKARNLENRIFELECELSDERELARAYHEEGA